MPYLAICILFLLKYFNLILTWDSIIVAFIFTVVLETNTESLRVQFFSSNASMSNGFQATDINFSQVFKRIGDLESKVEDLKLANQASKSAAKDLSCEIGNLEMKLSCVKEELSEMVNQNYEDEDEDLDEYYDED